MPFDLKVFNEQTYLALTETIDQDVSKFNEVSGGTIVLQNTPTKGDFDIRASFKAISGLVRRRNVYGQGTVASKRLEQLLSASVKIAAGTPPIIYENAQYRWIQQNPELAAIEIGTQLAKARLADMLNTGISAGVAAISSNTAMVLDEKTKAPTFDVLNKGAAKFGDRSGALRAWVMHSSTMHNLYSKALANTERLFTYDGINVIRDPFGRLFVVTDSPELVSTTSGTTYRTLGLVENGIVVNGNNDFDSVLEKRTGGENLQAIYQAEWSFNVGVYGYSWNTEGADKKSPTNTALASKANWSKSASFDKDTAGVLVLTA